MNIKPADNELLKNVHSSCPEVDTNANYCSTKFFQRRLSQKTNLQKQRVPDDVHMWQDYFIFNLSFTHGSDGAIEVPPPYAVYTLTNRPDHTGGYVGITASIFTHIFRSLRFIISRASA